VQSRDWNFVERHWAAAARTGDPALPLTTAASWADLRVDPPPGNVKPAIDRIFSYPATAHPKNQSSQAILSQLTLLLRQPLAVAVAFPTSSVHDPSSQCRHFLPLMPLTPVRDNATLNCSRVKFAMRILLRVLISLISDISVVVHFVSLRLIS
jgi:hypothetical protein